MQIPEYLHNINIFTLKCFKLEGIIIQPHPTTMWTFSVKVIYPIYVKSPFQNKTEDLELKHNQLIFEFFFKENKRTKHYFE